MYTHMGSRCLMSQHSPTSPSSCAELGWWKRFLLPVKAWILVEIQVLPVRGAVTTLMRNWVTFRAPWALQVIDLGQSDMSVEWWAGTPLLAQFLPEMVAISCQHLGVGFPSVSLPSSEAEAKGFGVWLQVPEVSPSQPLWELPPLRKVFLIKVAQEDPLFVSNNLDQYCVKHTFLGKENHRFCPIFSRFVIPKSLCPIGFRGGERRREP